MPIPKPKKTFLLLSFLFFYLNAFSQLPYNLVDGRINDDCQSCKDIIQQMPKEVLFGIQINDDGNVYFLMNNIEWFNKLFKNDSYGVSADLVSKDRYACGNNTASDDGNFSLPKGTMLYPVYKPELAKGINALSQGEVFVKIGTVPAALKGKQLEGNLMIMNGNYICHYTNFVNIDRNVWELLPMGLFTDSLIEDNKINADGKTDFFTYTKRIQVEVPFEKGSTGFNTGYLKGLYDSLQLTRYSIRKVEVRAYSSIEGPEVLNKQLMNKRADTILHALKKYQHFLPRVKVITAENWLDFFKDIEQSKFSDLKGLSKMEIKQKLTDKTMLAEIEPILAKHRKAVITMYLDEKSGESSISDPYIITEFKKAVDVKDIAKAKAIQKELVDRIMDNKLPVEYMNKLEVPQSKDFASLLNDREVYKYLLKATSEYEALDNFMALKKLDPQNGHINYNICALQFFMWQYGGDTLVSKTLLNDINALPVMGINNNLVQRMRINYYILSCEDDMKVYNYAGKDSALENIRDIYKGLTLTDDEIYSLAKYFTAYSHDDWATEIIIPRIDKIDISEDLVFYFVNLLFYSPDAYGSDIFRKAALNAINLNTKRFCDFFLPADKGGASMQLLEYKVIKALYCDACSDMNNEK
jgi:hypothetical protein